MTVKSEVLKVDIKKYSSKGEPDWKLTTEEKSLRNEQRNSKPLCRQGIVKDKAFIMDILKEAGMYMHSSDAGLPNIKLSTRLRLP